MKKVSRALVVFIVLICVTTMAQGAAFVCAPEDYAPDWVSSYPYQRNMLWDFDADPSITSVTYNGSDADVVYSGYDDPSLWTEDAVTMTGAVQWFSGVGAVGIDNLNGQETVQGTISFYVNNHDRSSPFKHVWVETPWLDVTDVSGASVSSFPPGVCFTSPVTGSTLSFSSWSDEELYTWYAVTPENPPYETFTIELSAAAGQLVYLDYVHVATECATVVPTPGAILLGSLGVGLIGWLRRRRAF